MSTSRCQPDDIAYIVSPYAFAPALGHVVTVERAAARREFIGHWVYEADANAPAWVCKGAVPDREGNVRTRLVIADECLLPMNRPSSAGQAERAAPTHLEVTA